MRALAALAFSAAVVACLPAVAQDEDPPLEAKPVRVVSLNLCVDQLVLLLAETGNVASVTWLSLDPDTSFVADLAAGVPKINHGFAEEILQLDPDLILAGQYTTSFTVQMLRRLGHRVEVLGIPATLEDVRAQIFRVGELLHEQATAASLVASMDAALAAVPDPADPRFRVAVFQPGGFTVGPGSFEHELLVAAGLRNVAEERGIQYYGYLALEDVLLARPDLLVSPDTNRRRPSLAEAVLQHPAARAAPTEARVLRMPQRLWFCPGPMNVHAIALLAEAAR